MTAGRVPRRPMLVSAAAVAALLTILLPPAGPSTAAERYTQQDQTSPIGSTLPGPETTSTSTTAPATGSSATSGTVTSNTAATPGAPAEVSVPATGAAPGDAGTRSGTGWLGWFIALAGLGAAFAAVVAAAITLAERRTTSPVAATLPGPPVPESTDSTRFRGRATGAGAEADIDDLIADLGDSPLGTALAEAKRIDDRIEALIDIVDLSADRHLASLAALALERRSMAPFGQAGQPFDPLRHNALGRVAVSDATQHRAVVNVDRQGWMNSEGRVVRKAYVTVGLHEAGSSSSL